jgi:hypothetical protein
MSLSPATLSVLAHAASRWAYNHLPCAEAVAKGSTDPLVCAHVARALLNDLDAKVLRHEYGHARGVRTVRRELDALVHEAVKAALRLVRDLARQDAEEGADDPYREGGAKAALASWLVDDREIATMVDLIGRDRAEQAYSAMREAIDARAERHAATAAELGR